MKKNFFLISHNKFAEGLQKALEMIAGKQENLQAFGMMPGDHPDTIIEKIKNQITEEMEVVILGDIAGGSVCNSALGLTVKPNVTLITGVNLPLALELIITQTTTKKEIDLLIKRSREEMKILELEPQEEKEEADAFFM